MLPLQACSGIITAIGNTVPPIALFGPILAIGIYAGGRKAASRIGHAYVSQGVAMARNGISWIIVLISLLSMLVTGYLSSKYPAECYSFLPL